MQTLIDLVPKSQAQLTQLPFGATNLWQHSKSFVKVDSFNDDYKSYECTKPSWWCIRSRTKPTPYVDWAPARKTTTHNIVRMLRRGADPHRQSPEPRELLLGSGFIAQPVVAYSCYSGKNTLPVATNDLYHAK